MAVLTSPPFDFDGPNEPTAQSVVVPTAQIALPIPIYTGGILSTPLFSQLLNVGGTFVGKALADGQLPTSTASALYTLSSAWVTAYLKKFMVFNTSAAEQRVRVYVLHAGNPLRQVNDFTLGLNEAADIIDTGEAILLNPGDSIYATATTANVVNYYIGGVLEAA